MSNDDEPLTVDDIARMLNTDPAESTGSVQPGSAPPGDQHTTADDLYGPAPGAAPVPAGPLADHFRVDPEAAEKLATAIDIAGEDVERLLARAGELSSARPGAADLVSLSAAAAMSGWADSGDGTLLPALRAYFQELLASAAGYRRHIAEIRQTDEQGAATYRGLDPVEGP